MTQREEYIKASHKATMEVLYHVLCAFLSLGAIYVIQRYVLNDFIGNLFVENPKIYCMVIWVVFILSSTIIEALLFLLESSTTEKENIKEHIIFTVYRACMLIPLWILTDWKCALSFLLIFFLYTMGSIIGGGKNLKQGPTLKNGLITAKPRPHFGLNTCQPLFV